MKKVNKQTNSDSSPKPSISKKHLRKEVAANDPKEVPHSPVEMLNSSNIDINTSSINQNTVPRDKTDEGREDEYCKEDSSKTKYQNGCHLIIETDDDSDRSLSKADKISTKSSGEYFSSTPNSGIKLANQKLGRHHRRKGKRLKKKSRISLQKHGTANTKLRLEKQPEQEESDSEWESVSDMETVSDGKEEQTVKDASDVEGPLLVDTDGSGDELDGSQIPLNDQLEKTIADGSARNNLSVSNVKSIIWTLLSHDLVKELLKTKLKAVDGDEDDGGDVFEPKLTRSKMKEVLEKGNDGKGWPLSPVKLGQSSTAGPSILDVEFSEDEDEEDDEYQPSKDAADLESDDDSIVSSNVSDIGSPFLFSSPLSKTPSSSITFAPSAPSTPTTPTASGPHSSTYPTSPRTPSKERAESENTVHIMGPPVGLPPSSHSTRQRLVFKSPEKQSREVGETTEDDGIAGRTRSKLPLTTTSLYDIEEAFVAPDITPDMYDTMCDDSDWQEFLKSLHKLEGPAEAEDPHNESVEQGEDDDPEFNYSAEAEEIDLEEARFDGPFRISRKELNILLEELGDLFNEDDYSMIGLRTNLASAHHNAALLAKKPDGSAQQEAVQISVSSQSSGSVGKDIGREAGPSAAEESAAEGSQPVLMQVQSPSISDQQVKLIEEHMRKHIQLLTQMYLLAQGSDDFHPMADTCRKLMEELEHFGRLSTAGPKSMFHACNVAGAVEIVKCDIDWASLRQQRPGTQTTERSTSQPAASVSLEVDGDSVNSAQEEGCGRIAGESSQKERGQRAENAVTLEADKSFRAQKKNLGKSRPPLLEMQKEILWSSPVFLYPSFLPSQGLAPKDTILEYSRSACGRTHFCPGEDALLVLGREQFKKWTGRQVFEMIHQYLMPCKDPKRLDVRFFGRRKNKDNCIVRYRQTGDVPKGPETAELFTHHMMKAPCDQPDSLLPKTWRLHRRKLHFAKLKQAKEKQLRKEEEKRKRQEEEHRKRKAEKRQRKKLAMGERRGQEELDGQSAVDPGTGTGELSTELQDRSESTGEPPEKVRRMDTRPEQAVGSEASTHPVSIQSSLSSAEGNTPSSLLTSQGMYVSLDLADLAKLRTILPASHVLVIEESGKQNVVSMGNHLSDKSKSITSDEDLCDVLSSLSDLTARSGAAGLQADGSGEPMDLMQEPDSENPDCGGDVRKESDSTRGGKGSQGPGSHQLTFQSREVHGEEMQKECAHSETGNPTRPQNGSLGQDCVGSEAGHSTMDVDEVQTGQNCTQEVNIEKTRERESLGNEIVVNKVTNFPHSEGDQDMLSCSREELLCEQQEDESVRSRDESLSGFDDSCEETVNEPKGSDGSSPIEIMQEHVSEQQSMHHSVKQISADVNFACDPPPEAQHCTEQIPEERESSIRKNSVSSESVGDHTRDIQNPASNHADTDPDITDSEKTAGEVSDPRTVSDPQCAVQPQNKEDQARNTSAVESESQQEQGSSDGGRREMQQECSAGTGSRPNPPIHVGLIFHVQARRLHDKLCMLGLPHSQDEKSLKDLDTVEDVMRKMWRSPKDHWLGKYEAQEHSESIKFSSPEISFFEKPLKPGIVTVVVINMMYRANYSQMQNTEDTAESPSSTTPDGNSGSTGEQGEISHQAETQDTPDNGVSTTSDIGEPRPGESSAPASPACAAAPQQSVESSSALSTVCADSSNASPYLLPYPEPRASVLAGMPGTSRGTEEEGNCVSSSSPGLRVSVEQQNLLWSSLSFVDSSADLEDARNASPEVVQEPVPSQNADSVFGAPTSGSDLGVGSVSDSQSTSAGNVEEIAQEHNVVFSGSGVAHGKGRTVSNWSDVSSSDLFSVFAGDSDVQYELSQSRKLTDSACEASTSRGDSQERRRENTYTGSSSHTVSQTHTAHDSGDALQSHTTDDEQDSQRLLRLIESGRSGGSQGEASDQSVTLTTVEGSAQSTADTAVSVFRHEGDQSTLATGVVETEGEASPVKEHFSMQSINERSPPPHTPYVDVELPSAIDAPAVQPPSETSPAPHALLCAFPESLVTPTVLSCLGLVSAKHAGASATQPRTSTTQNGSDPCAQSSPCSSSTIATLTPFCSVSPPKAYALHYTPEKSPPKPLRTLVPKPGLLTYPSPPCVPVRRSPKKKQLQKQVRAILPKGYSYELKMSSPTKAAARTLKKKATLFCQRSPSKPILPKDPSMVQTQASSHSGSLHPSTSTLLPWNRRGRRAKRKKEKLEATTVTAETTAKKTLAHSSNSKGQEERNQEESDETGSEVEDIALMSQDDSQNEEEAGEAEDDQTYMQDLMAASTTIGFNPYIKAAPDKDGQGSKQEVRRQQKLSLLAFDVVETDPQRDDRDLAQAQLYMNKVKVAMQKDLPTYTQFVDFLRQFETTQASPVEMYESLRGVLVNYPELLEDFAGFLQPGQALQTRCHVPNQLMHELRAFLRKMELHYGLKGSRYAKILRAVGKWDFKNKSPARLRELLLPLLGSTVPQHLLDDFVLFFPDVAPPDSHMETGDFEDIDLRDSDDDGNRSPDDFEDITFPDENDPYRTRRCPCNCHKASMNKRKKKEKYTTHCYKCCLKVVEGQLYFQPSNVTTRRPVSATFYNSVPMPLPPDLPPPSARSRGAFHHSAILDEVDDDDHDDDLEDDIELDEDDAHADTEDDKGTEDEKPETEEDDEKPVTEDDDEEDDEEDFEEEDEEELTEEEENCSPAKQRRMADTREGESSWTAPATSKETLQPSSVELGSQLSPTQRTFLRQPDNPQSLSPQPKPQQTSDKHSAEQHSVAQRTLLQQPLAQQPMIQHPVSQHPLALHPTQQSLAQHAVTQHPQQSLVTQVLAQHAATKELLSQNPVGGQSGSQQPQRCGLEEVVQPLTSRRPASPSLPSVTVLPAAAGLHGKRIRLPKPGESNIRMRKRILSMQPGRQVSLSMQTLAPKPGMTQETDASPELQSANPSPGLSPTISLLPPSGSAASWKPPRIMSNKTLGTVSVVGPDNTVIMFNSSLPNPALGETLPGLHGDMRTGLMKALEESGKEEEEKDSLPTITSPHKNMERGNFAGLLQGAQSSEINQPSMSLASLEPGLGGDSVTPASSDSMMLTHPVSSSAAPLMSEDTLSVLFEQMREGQRTGEVSTPFDVHSNSSLSSLLSKMMQYPEGQQEPADPTKHTAGLCSTALPQPMDLSAPSHSPPSSILQLPGLAPDSHQEEASNDDTVEWTSEQDRLIVEMVRDHGASADTYSQIAAQLEDVTPTQVSERVSTLVEFLDMSEGEEAEEDEDL